MKLLGLIGYPLGHSFSKKYFTQKFENEGLTHDWKYELFPIDTIDKLPDILRGLNHNSQQDKLIGLNVTIPYKEAILPYINEMDITASEVGAVNCIKISYIAGKPYLKGYNTDYYGFQKSLLGLLDLDKSTVKTKEWKALILGTGGSAKAVAYALKDLNIHYQYVSRNPINGGLTYDDLNSDSFKAYNIIVNTTPLGMSPNTEGCAPIPYQYIDSQYFMYDLVYNPAVTTFLQKGLSQGAKVKSGLDMLHFQAEKGWEIWQN
jgi:shikimate dehydrogenase